jgi:hypothetical protein
MYLMLVSHTRRTDTPLPLSAVWPQTLRVPQSSRRPYRSVIEGSRDSSLPSSPTTMICSLSTEFSANMHRSSRARAPLGYSTTT